MLASDITVRVVKSTRWAWAAIWAVFLALMLLVPLMYVGMPSDGVTGDLESLSALDGSAFLVRYVLESREGGPQPGDIILRVDGYTVAALLNGAARGADAWQTGDVLRYDVLRDEQPLTLNVELRPVSPLTVITHAPLTLLVVLSYSLMGTFLFVRLPDDGAAQRTMLFMMAAALMFYIDLYNFQLLAVPWHNAFWVHVAVEHFGYNLAYVAAAVLALHFPARSPLLHRHPLLLPTAIYLVCFAPVLAGLVLGETSAEKLYFSNRLAFVGSSIAQALVIFALGRQLRRKLDPIMRSQLLWLFWSTGIVGVVFLSTYVVPLVTDSTWLVPTGFFSIVALLIPVSLAVAILRFKLFEIDLVINRSLVYGALTLLLGGVFLLGVRVLENVLGTAGGAQVAAALLVGMLFNPVRLRMQHLVDRRLFGLRFDLNELQRATHRPDIRNPGYYTGMTFGGFELLGVIGYGGMGEVYKGVRGSEVVAVKTMLPTFASAQEYRERFQHEAQVTAMMSHPNIVGYRGAGIVDSIYYLALEYIDGVNLKEMLHEKGKLALDDARDILCDVAKAVTYMHANGWIHRDLKPGNVMLTPSGDNETYRATLMDFGLAKVETNLSQTGEEAVGTIDYMAPEQITAAQHIDQRADVYALGVMMFEMLTGAMPFKGGLAQVLFAYLHQPAPNPREIEPSIPVHTSLAIMRALAKDPDDRYPTVGALVEALFAA